MNDRDASRELAPVRTEVAGVGFDPLTEAELVRWIVKHARSGAGGWVITPNTDIVRHCARDSRVAALVASADVVVPDGMPLVWASKLAGTPLPERVAGSNLVWSLSAAAAQAGLSIFLMGGKPGAIEGASKNLLAHHPDLRIAGTFFPEYGFEEDAQAIEEIERALGDAQPDVVFIALSFPKADDLIARLRTLLPGAWWIGVGISFSFLAGQVRRAPPWMRRLGLEWLHRLMQEPRKLMRRYLLEDVPFALRMLGGALRRRVLGTR